MDEDREQVLIRMPPALVEAVKQRADQHERTYNREIVQIVKETVEQEQTQALVRTSVLERVNFMALAFDQIDEAQRFLEDEQRAERYALHFLYGTNFTDCLRINQIPEKITVTKRDKKGNDKEETIRGQDIYDKRAWEKFLTWAKVVTPPTKFTGNVDRLASQLVEWLSAHYTERYRSIVDDKYDEWLKVVTRVVIIKRIMENKHALWIKEQRGFADPWVAQEMGRILNFNHELEEVAKVVHFAIERHAEQETTQDEKDLAQEIIQGLFKMMHDHHVQSKGIARPQILKQLPFGTPLPFNGLETNEDNSHE